MKSLQEVVMDEILLLPSKISITKVFQLISITLLLLYVHANISFTRGMYIGCRLLLSQVVFDSTYW
jgi:hypothetical protein